VTSCKIQDKVVQESQGSEAYEAKEAKAKEAWEAKKTRGAKEAKEAKESPCLEINFLTCHRIELLLPSLFAQAELQPGITTQIEANYKLRIHKGVHTAVVAIGLSRAYPNVNKHFSNGKQPICQELCPPEISSFRQAVKVSAHPLRFLC